MNSGSSAGLPKSGVYLSLTSSLPVLSVITEVLLRWS
jgi:hypothetical protein